MPIIRYHVRYAVRSDGENASVHDNNVPMGQSLRALEPYRQTGKGWTNESRDFKKDRERVSGTQRFIGTIQTQAASLVTIIVRKGKGICSGLLAVFTRLKRDFNHHMTSRGNRG